MPLRRLACLVQYHVLALVAASFSRRRFLCGSPSDSVSAVPMESLQFQGSEGVGEADVAFAVRGHDFDGHWRVLASHWRQ